MAKTIQRKLLTSYQEKEIRVCSNNKMSQYGDQSTIKVNIRELEFVGFEIASCYVRLSWELDVKLERKEKRSCYSLAVAGNKSATRPPLPPQGCGGEWKETGRNWWVGIRAA